MRIELRIRNANVPMFVEEYTERRLRFALDRYGSRIRRVRVCITDLNGPRGRSEEHTSELQSQSNLVCRLLLEKKKNTHEAYRSVLLTTDLHYHPLGFDVLRPHAIIINRRGREYASSHPLPLVQFIGIVCCARE